MRTGSKEHCELDARRCEMLAYDQPKGVELALR